MWIEVTPPDWQVRDGQIPLVERRFRIQIAGREPSLEWPWVGDEGREWDGDDWSSQTREPFVKGYSYVLAKVGEPTETLHDGSYDAHHLRNWAGGADDASHDNVMSNVSETVYSIPHTGRAEFTLTIPPAYKQCHGVHRSEPCER